MPDSANSNRANPDTVLSVPPQKQQTKPNIETIGYLSEESYRFGQADRFPLSLGQRGRLSMSSHRGMPPGVARYRYGGFALINPVTGFWNEQWLPYYQIAHRQQMLGLPEQALIPPTLLNDKPMSRIIFSQDYIVNINFVDINFHKKMSHTNYVQLSGANFTSNGSQANNYSKTDNNTYRAQLHYEFGNRWKADIFYWQMRQRFTMKPSSAFSPDRFKQIGHIAWVQLSAKINAHDSVVVLPSYTTIEDRYTVSNDVVKNNRYHIIGGEAHYIRRFQNLEAGLLLNGQAYSISGDRFWTKRNNEAQLTFQGSVGIEQERWRLQSRTGFMVSEHGTRPTGDAALEFDLSDSAIFGLSGFHYATLAPYLWRTIQHDDIAAYDGAEYGTQLGINAYYARDIGQDWRIQIEPFANRVYTHPVYFETSNRWFTETVDAYGVRVKTNSRLWKFALENDFFYNANHTNSFGPQINNITTLKLGLSLFNDAFPLQGIVSWQYIGYLDVLNMDRLLLHFSRSELEQGPYYIGDATVQGRFNQAIIFFKWENFISQDYVIVADTIEDFLIFRLGVDWVLFE